MFPVVDRLERVFEDRPIPISKIFRYYKSATKWLHNTLYS